MKSKLLDAEQPKIMRSDLNLNPLTLVPTEPPSLEDDAEEDQELTMEPKRAEEEAEERKEDEEDELDEVGEEDKAMVEVVKPLAEPEDRESRAEAAGQSHSRTSSPSSPASPSNQPQGRVLFCPAFRVSLHALSQRSRLQGHAHQRLVTLLRPQLCCIPVRWLKDQPFKPLSILFDQKILKKNTTESAS